MYTYRVFAIRQNVDSRSLFVVEFHKAHVPRDTSYVHKITNECMGFYDEYIIFIIIVVVIVVYTYYYCVVVGT